MTHFIRIASRNEFDSNHLREMHILRARIFKEKRGWAIPVADGLEVDDYDALNPYYLMVHEPSRGVCGCLRALPTEGPYMLKNTFPELLHGQPPPSHPGIWELSRLAIGAKGQHRYGFSEVALDAFREAVRFAERMGIERYVIVTTSPVERMLRRKGLAVNRYGPPLRIGVEDAVALEVDIGRQTHDALFGEGRI